MAAGLSESADPGWPGDLGVGVGGERVQELGDSERPEATCAYPGGKAWAFIF